MNQIAAPIYKQWAMGSAATFTVCNIAMFKFAVVWSHSKKHQAKQNINLMAYLSSIISTCKLMYIKITHVNKHWSFFSLHIHKI